MDATWDGTSLHCKWTDLLKRIKNKTISLVPFWSVMYLQSNYWKPIKIIVSEVNCESLMEYFKSLQDLWTQAVHTVYIFVHN